MEIVKDEKLLRQKSTPVKSLDEIQEITEHLFITLLEKNDNDVGISAPQIGIMKQVILVRAKENIVLVNPRIIETGGETWYQEGCLSFPGSSVRTRRHTEIVVEVDYLGIGNVVMQSWTKNVKLCFASKNKPDVNIEDDKGLLEAVAVQHEIDHLNGILMFDREWKGKTIRNTKKYGRNEKVIIVHPGTNERINSIKYKRAEEYLNKGWTILEN